VVIELTAISIYLPSDGHFQTDTPATSKCIVTLTTASGRQCRRVFIGVIFFSKSAFCFRFVS